MSNQQILGNGAKITNKTSSGGARIASLLLEQQRAKEEEKKKYQEIYAQQQASQNNGGLLGGIGYAFEKLGLGFLQSVEGIWDYTAGGLAKLFGADDWAEQQFANDWVDYGHADKWFNPDDGWRVVGDVAGGIGTSAPAIITTVAAGAIAVASGGSLSPLAAALISGAVAGLGAAGTATKDAYRQTGELGGKEFGYGALSGITEGAVEGLSAGIGAGTGQIVKGISKSFGKEVAQSAARQTFGKTVIKGFLGEAFEEGVSEMLDPVWQRLTFNPDAKNATIQEIGYAALIGGLSGAIMGGIDVSVRNGVNLRRGSQITMQGKTNNVIELAEQISTYETENQTGYEQFEIVKNTLAELRESLQKTNGEIKTAKQRMLVGYLEQANTSAIFTPTMAKSAENIVNNADAIAERLTAYGYKDTSGKPITFTGEQIRQGFDITNPKSFAKTLKNNEVLRSLVVADTTGHLLMDTSKFRDATLAGQQLSGQVDLNRFIEQSTDGEKAAVAEKLGIADWNTLTVEDFNEKIKGFAQNQGIDEARERNTLIRELNQLDTAKIKQLPRTISMKKDGVARYSIGESSVAVIKSGETFRIYDYSTGNMSKPLARAELNKVLRDVYIKAENSATSSTLVAERQINADKQTVNETKFARDAKELDTYCRENIKDYAKLGSANQSMIRMGLRMCRAAGISEQWSLTYARVSARTGLNIVISKELCFVNANGSYADGAIDIKNNRIIINPETKGRTGEMVLIHELTHAIYNSQDGVLTVAQGVETMTDEEKKKIRDRYSAVGRGSAIEVSDEINAHFAEQTLANVNILERLLKDKPTVKQKILSFFTKSKTDYSDDIRLSRAAQKLYNQYKRLFDEFAGGTRKTSGNQFSNASENATITSVKQALPEIEQEAVAKFGHTYKWSETGYVLIDGSRLDFSGKKDGASGGYRTVDHREVQQISFYDNLSATDSLIDFMKRGNIRVLPEYGGINLSVLPTKAQENALLDFISLKRGEITLDIDSATGDTLVSVEYPRGTHYTKILQDIRNYFKDGSKPTVSSLNKFRFALKIGDETVGTHGKYSFDTESEKVLMEIAAQNDIENFLPKGLSKEFVRAIRNHGNFTYPRLYRGMEAAELENIRKNGYIKSNGEYNFDFQKGETFFSHDIREAFSYATGFAPRDIAKLFFEQDKPAYIVEVGNYDLLSFKYNSAKESSTRNEIDVKYITRVLELHYNKEDNKVYVKDVNIDGMNNVKDEFVHGVPMFVKDKTTGQLLYAVQDNDGYETGEYISANNPDFIINYERLSNDTPELRKMQLGFLNISGNESDLVPYNPTKYALPETDSAGKKLSEQQRRFFADSKVVDEKGRLLVVYHGTRSGKFTIFEHGKGKKNDAGWLGEGFYFYGDEHEASMYATGGGRIIEAYLNVKNPYYATDEDMARLAELDDEIESREFSESLKADGYDGVYYNGDLRQEWVVFEPNQIKQTTNLAPTSDNDIRYALGDILSKYDKQTDVLSVHEHNDKIAISNIVVKKNLRNSGIGQAILDDIIRYADANNKTITLTPTTEFGTKERLKRWYKRNGFVENKGRNTDFTISDTMYRLPQKGLESRRSKPIDGQMDIFRDILGVEYSEQLEQWDSQYTKQAKSNADNIIQLYKERGYEQATGDTGQGRNNASNDGKGRSVYDAKAIRSLFERKRVQAAEDRRLYSKIVKELNGYSVISPYNGWSFDAIKKEFYTYDMVRIAEVNAANGVGTVFFLDDGIYKVGKRQFSTSGLYFLNGTTVYIRALQSDNKVRVPLEVKTISSKSGRVTYQFDYASAYTDESKSAAIRGAGDQTRTTMRHERMHLVFNATKRQSSQFGNATYDAAREFLRFVEQRFAGRTDDVHRSIKDYYVKELGYGTVETSIEEIACDLYSGDLVLNNEVERTEIQKYVDDIDKTLKNVVGQDGVRYALPQDSDRKGGLTRGQRAKFVANNTKLKVYSKAEAEAVINAIIDERLNIDTKIGSISGKTKEQAIEMLFTRLNNTPEDYRLTVALHLADYILDNAVLTDMYEMYDSDNSFLMEKMSGLRSVMHSFNLDGIRDEIKHKYDDRSGVIYRMWGAKSDGKTADVIMRDTLAEYGISTDAINEADIFFEIVDLYESTRDSLKKKVDTVKISAYGGKEQIDRLRQRIAKDILLAYDEKGTQSKYGKLVEKYTKQIESLRGQVRNARKINSIVNNIVDTAAYLRDVARKRKYVGAEVFNTPELTVWLESLGKLKFRANMRQTGAREILLNYGKFYNTNNALLYDSNPDLNYIDQNVLDAIEVIKANESDTKPLSVEELQAAQVILSSAKHLFQNYDQIKIDGRKQSITDLATAEMDILRDSSNRTGKGFFARIYGVFNQIVEPRVVIKSLENYNPHGILTKAYQEVTNGETAAGLMYIEMMEDFDKFFKINKKYKRRLTAEYVTVGGKKLTIGQAISLYELSRRPQARDGLYESGVSFVDANGVKTTLRVTESDIAETQKNFNSTDQQFIGVVEKFFNVTSKQIKTNADMEILGYTNASDDFYFPIKRDSGTIAKNITDARSLMADWANVYNFSFNKDVKAGAKNKLFIGDVYSIVTRHAKQLSTYANLTIPLKNFSQIYAKNIGSKTDVQSIRNTLNERVWGGAESYLSKLFADIQGKATSNSFVEKLRGMYAKYQLGANLKVIVSQVTSYPTAGILLDFSSMTKGFVMNTNWATMDQYCAYARVRNYEKGIVRAESVVDKVGKVGDMLTKPIQWTDRFTIGKLWNACQVQVQKDSGHKIGTEENLKQAGALLEEVVRLTQPNYTNTERSALMRSDSDIVRSFTMFTSVPLKQLSRLVESIGEYNALRKLVKKTDDVAIKQRYKLAKKKLGRTFAAITVANLMYVLVGQFFKWLYNKDRTDKDGNEISFLQDLMQDFVSTSVGMFPIIKDIYAFFANDYEISSFWADSLNGILSSTRELFDMTTKAVGGEPMETDDYMRPLRNSLYAIGQLTGLPIRNINNTIIGLIRHFSPSTAYKYDALFYNAQYSKDIKKALADGDTELAETIMGLLLDEDNAGDLDSVARKKIMDLYAKEYSVLPRSIGKTITFNGEEYKLTDKQRKQFKDIYQQANQFVQQMVQGDAFNALSEKMQARAIKQIYDAYYDKALETVLEVTTDNKLLLISSAVRFDKLSVALAGMADITADIDRNGNAISGSKKKKTIKYLLQQKELNHAERLLLMCLNGYSIKDGDYMSYSVTKAKRVLLRYILRLKISKEQRTQLAELCGFQVKNGRVIIR